MIFLDSKTYNETLALKRKERSLNLLFAQLAEFVFEMYGIVMLNYKYDFLDDGQPRLNLILDNKTQYNKMHENGNGNFGFNQEFQKCIADRFTELVANMRLETQYQTSNLWVIYNDFSSEVVTDVNYRTVSNTRKKIVKKFSKRAVWNIYDVFTSITVFCMTDADVTRNQSNGVSDSIREILLREAKRLDEFGYLSEVGWQVFFDSKENVDKNYEGNLYYYFK